MSTRSRRSSLFSLLLSALLAAISARDARACEGSPELERLESWASRYRLRKISFFEPMRGIPGSEPRFLDRGAVSELREVLEAASGSDCLEVAKELASLATFSFSGHPDREHVRSEKHAIHRPAWVRERARETLASMSDPAVRGWLLDELDELGGPRASLGRELAARVLGRQEWSGALYGLRRRLADRTSSVRIAAVNALDAIAGEASFALLGPALDDRKAEVRAVAIQTVRERARMLRTLDPGSTFLSHATSILVESLRDPSWWVRLSAAEGLGELRAHKSIDPLISALGDERPGRVRDPNDRVRGALHAALVSLTARHLPADDAGAWKRFWEAARDGFEVAADSALDERYTPSFYGVTLKARRLLFVVDVSTSMAYPAPGSRYAGGVETKLDHVKRELRRSLDALDGRTEFDLLFFAQGRRRWKGELVRATPDSIEEAKAFVMAQRVMGGTDLYGALEAALDLARPGEPHRRVGADVDAVIVLSDGWPSVGEFREPETIVRLVSRANRYARTAIHTIAIEGTETPLGRTAPPLPFMEELAARNYGQFRRIHLD